MNTEQAGGSHKGNEEPGIKIKFGKNRTPT